jgi:predicted outer membrane repeat protein
MLRWPFVFVLAVSAAGCFFDFERGVDLEPGDVAGHALVETEPAAYARVLPAGTGSLTRTGANGDFHIRGLAAGGYTLSIAHDENGDGWPERAASRAFAISQQEHADGLFGTGAAELTWVAMGDVTLDAVVEARGIVTRGGIGVGGARVYVWGRREVPAATVGDGVQVDSLTIDTPAEAWTTTDADGEFRFPALAAGELTFAAFFDGDTANADTASVPVTLDAASGSSITPSDLTLSLETPPNERDVQLELSPVPDGELEVRLEREGVPPAQLGPEDIFTTSIADASRSVSFRAPIGSWKVTVTDGVRSVAQSLYVSPMPGPALVTWRLTLSESDPCTRDDLRDCDGDGLQGLPPLEGWSDDEAESTWLPCAATCGALFGSALAGAACEVGGETYDCDDDGDGQPDVTEHYDCYGLFAGDDRDGDGACSTDDPFPQCAENDASHPECDADRADAFDPPPVRPELASPPVDAGPSDGGFDGGADGSPDGGTDAGFDGGADSGADAGNDAGDAGADPVDAGPTCTVGDGYASIQSALDDTGCGTVVIPSGTYVENLAIARTVAVQGEGRNTTTVQGDGSATVVAITGATGVTLSGLRVTGGVTTGFGGGVSSDAADVVLDDVRVDGNAATQLGGGIYAAGNLTLRNSLVDGNTGGGVFIVHGTGGDSRIENSRLTQNTDALRGGGLYVEGPFGRTVTLVDTVVDFNSASSYGGGIGSSLSGTLRLEGTSTVADNTTTEDGGGIGVARGTVELIGTTVERNEAQGDGGGISIGALASTLYVEGATISGNRLPTGGTGAGIVSREPITLVNTDVIGNQLTGTADHHRGAGIALREGGALTVTGGRISNNTSTGGLGGFGAGIYYAMQSSSPSATVDLTGVEVNGNTIAFNGLSGRWSAGAGIYLEAISGDDTRTLTVNIRDCAITNNTSTALDTTPGSPIQGGGVMVYTSALPTNVTVTNSTISGNQLVADATDAEGGGIFLHAWAAATNVELRNVTVANNSATSVGGTARGGGVHLSFSDNGGSSTLSPYNTVIADNVGASGADCWTDPSATVQSGGYNLFTDVSDCTIGGDTTGNVTGASGLLSLADNGGATQTHGLEMSSAARDNGNPSGCVDAAMQAITTDQRGAARPFNSVCDIGAFEAGAGE